MSRQQRIARMKDAEQKRKSKETFKKNKQDELNKAKSSINKQTLDGENTDRLSK